MALLAKIHRRIIDLGLLPKTIKFLPFTSMACSIIGIFLFMLLPLDGQYRRTYISENALMPSQAYSYFRESEWNILRGYRDEIEYFEDMPSKYRNSIIAQWLDEFGFKSTIYHDEQFGDSLYGVYTAPRGDNTESIVLAIPWINSDKEFNYGGAALGVSLSRFFARWPIWSKNIIVVFSDNPDGALRSWVNAYHTSLDLTGGSIEAAVILDFPTKNDFFDYVEIYYHGLNGELPNLDLVNIASQITEHEGMSVSLHGISQEDAKKNTYFSRLRNLFLGTKDSILSGIKSRHGNEAFSGWRIQAVTLKAKFTEGHNDNDITCFGRIAEAMFRSVNNLLEKFHQSFFFYLLLSPKYFVSISSYLPSAVCFSVAFALSSLDSFINNQYSVLPFYSEYNLIAGGCLFFSILFSFIIAKVFLLTSSVVDSHILIYTAIFLSIIPVLTNRFVKIPEPLSYRLRSAAYIYFSIVLTSLLVVNFSLAFVMGILGYAMVAVKSQPQSGSTKSLLRVQIKNIFHLCISNPFVALSLFVTFFDDELNAQSLIIGLREAWNSLSCWTWFVLCIGWLPAWILVMVSSYATKPVTVAQTNNEKKHL